MTKQKLIETTNAKIKEVEEQIVFYREEMEKTTDITTKEMFENSINFAKGKWYGLQSVLYDIIHG